MGLLLKKENGVVRPWWYGEYRLGNGKRTVANLGVRVEGKPPDGGKILGRGDAAFERSRSEALVALEALKQGAVGERMTRIAAMRQYQERTGEKLSAAGIHALAPVLTGKTIWRGKQRRMVEKFAEWAAGEGLATVLDVRVRNAAEYIGMIRGRNGVTAATARKAKTTLALAFDRVLPEEAPNPFRHPTLRIKPEEGDAEHHREPLTSGEVDNVIRTAWLVDPEAHDWMVCALTTGLRRGDVCRLRWDAVDDAAGTLRVKTSKTREVVHLPIMPRLAEVLARRHQNSEDGKSPFVFPEAERLMREHPAQLTTRVKKVFVAALAGFAEKGAGGIPRGA